MAFTKSTAMDTVFGNERVWSGRITADAATGTVLIGSRIVALLAAGVASAATENTGPGFAMCAINVTPSGTAANGYVSFSGCTTSKVLNVTVAYV